MDDDNNESNNNNHRRNSYPDAQGHWYSQLTSSLPSLLSTTATTATMSNTLLSTTTTDQEASEKAIAATIQSETICISSDDSMGNDEEEVEMTSPLSQECRPVAASTPLLPISTTTITRTERELENELFSNIEQLVRVFVNRPDRQYPYYRVMRWTTGEQPKIEHLVTVVINRPSIIL